MSFQVYDERGFRADFATNTGTHNYFSYLRGLSIEALNQLVEEGYDVVPAAILETLSEVSVPEGDLKITHENFLKTLESCKGVVIISDGINDDLEDAEEEI